jgi:hypothetical protein
MTRMILPLAWRLLLAVSLVVGPWPPAAWAAVASTAQPAADVMDCHGDQAASAPQADSAPCEDGCCPDPACDPAHCLVLHASIAAPPLVAASLVIPAVVLLPRDARLHTGPPLRSLLRPPIA